MLRNLRKLRRRMRMTASSFVSSLAAERRPASSSKIDIRQLLPVTIAHDIAGVLFLDGPQRRGSGERSFGGIYFPKSESL